MPVKSAFLSASKRFSTDLDKASSWGVSAVGISTVTLLGTVWQPRTDVRATNATASRALWLIIVPSTAGWLNYLQHALRRTNAIRDLIYRVSWILCKGTSNDNAMFYLITLSALASTFGGIVR